MQAYAQQTAASRFYLRCAAAFPVLVLPGSLPENARHINGGFLQHFLLDVGVDVGGGLVVVVTVDLHGDRLICLS